MKELPETIDWSEIDETLAQVDQEVAYRHSYERWRAMTIADKQAALLQRREALKSPDLIRAFCTVDRTDFLPSHLANFALADHPLVVEPGFTNSQPFTVAKMLEWLQPKEGQRILDVGAGTAWTCALLAEVVGSQGQVVGTEIRPQAIRIGQRNLKKYRYRNISLQHTPETLGYPDQGPYDRILVSASALEIPEPLVDQLKVGGRMVIPVENDILVLEKKRNHRKERASNKRLRIETYPGFYFVPLITDRETRDPDDQLASYAGWFDVDDTPNA